MPGLSWTCAQHVAGMCAHLQGWRRAEIGQAEVVEVQVCAHGLHQPRLRHVHVEREDAAARQPEERRGRPAGQREPPLVYLGGNKYLQSEERCKQATPRLLKWKRVCSVTEKGCKQPTPRQLVWKSTLSRIKLHCTPCNGPPLLGILHAHSVQEHACLSFIIKSL